MTIPIGEGQLPLLAPHRALELDRLKGPASAPEPGQGTAIPFADTLISALKSANDAAHTADAAQNAFAAGKTDDIHGTMIAVKEADIELRLVANVRNKLVDAFNDLWRMNF